MEKVLKQSENSMNKLIDFDTCKQHLENEYKNTHAFSHPHCGLDSIRITNKNRKSK